MKNQNGITLVELITALALVGIITVVIGSVLSTGISSADRTTSKQRLQQEANYIVEAIKMEYLKDNEIPIKVEITGNKLVLNRLGENTKIISEGYDYEFEPGVDSQCLPETQLCRQINPSLNEKFHLAIKDGSERFSVQTIFNKLH